MADDRFEKPAWRAVRFLSTALWPLFMKVLKFSLAFSIFGATLSVKSAILTSSNIFGALMFSNNYGALISSNLALKASWKVAIENTASVLQSSSSSSSTLSMYGSSVLSAYSYYSSSSSHESLERLSFSSSSTSHSSANISAVKSGSS